MGGRSDHETDEANRTADRVESHEAGATATRRRVLRTGVATTLAATTVGAGVASGAEVIERSLTVDAVDAGTPEQGATVGFDDGTVTVEGRLPAPNPCYTAQLGDVRFEDDVLVVPVEVALDETAKEACPEVVAAVAYTATVSVDEPPATVRVDHRSGDGWTEEFPVEGPSGPINPVVENLTVGATTATSVRLEWNLIGLGVPNTTPVDHYNVYVDGDLDHRVEDADATETTISGLAPDATYELAVAAADLAGNETEPRTVTATTRPSQSPPVVGQGDAPRDPDDDGLYEDVNGDGTTNLADAGDLFQYRESSSVTGNVDAYDFSGNDEVDLADVVDLFQENAG